MSFILDALRKSEASRQAQSGPMPGVMHGATHQASQPERRTGIGVRAVVLALLGCLALAFVFNYWLVPDTESAGQDSLVGAIQRGDLSVPSVAALDIVGTPLSQPEPDQGLQDASQSVTIAEPEGPTEARESVSDHNMPTANAPNHRRPPASVVNIEPDVAVLEQALIEATADAPPSLEEFSERSTGEDGLGQWQPMAPDYLYHWELPFTVRQALPALDLTIHVFAQEPKDRFVLINGVRHREGDQIGAGAVLAQIRPEGALVDFRDYRFLLTR